MLVEKIDIKGGRFKYEHRIELGALLASDKDEIEKFRETFFILHGGYPDFGKKKEIEFYSEYFEEIIQGILFWIDKEKLLKYDPDPEEVKAGIYEYGKKVGHFGTVKALAKNYGCDPDDILKWDYAKVWGILYTDLEEHKYEKRLHRIHISKYK